jgi:two-component system chemotaxis response regulator CheY
MAELRKVLVVDDSKLIQQMYRLIFSKYKGCQVLGALNGLEALDVLASQDGIDLIVLDINMPVMNGVEFMQKLKSEGLYRHIPIIVISTEGKEEDTRKALKLGAWGYIVKPFKTEMLYEMVDKVLAKKPAYLYGQK